MRHTPLAEYGSRSADLVYGVLESGRIVHVASVPSGLECRCRCPGCSNPLIARKGAELTHHFGHAAFVTCQNAPETALHRLAKQIVHDKLMLRVPEVTATFMEQSRRLHAEAVVAFDRAIMEARHLNEVIPDLFVERGDRRLLVEIYVTHPCDKQKLAELRAKGIATLEIDLSKMPRDATEAEVEKAVLHEAPRTWVYHPKIDAAIAAWAHAAAKRRAAADAALGRRAAELSAEYKAGSDALASRASRKLRPDTIFRRVGLADHIGLQTGGVGCFTVGPAEWQYLILNNAFIPKDDTARSYRVKSLLDWLKKRKLIRPPFTYVDPKLEEALAGRGIGFLSPYRAIEAYLDELVKRGVLVKYKSYSLTSDIFAAICGIREDDERRKAQTEDICSRAGKIIASLPENESSGLTAESWLRQSQESGVSFFEAIEADDPRLHGMSASLARIETMLFCKGPIVDATLGLPIAMERERCRHAKEVEIRRRESERQEALRKSEEERHERLVSASTALGYDGQDWIKTTNDELGARKPIDMAKAGERELIEALDKLNREVTRRRAAREREEELQSLRYNLEYCVSQILGEAAKPFLGSPFPLGPYQKKQKPRDYCVSAVTLQECLDLAEKVRRERR